MRRRPSAHLVDADRGTGGGAALQAVRAALGQLLQQEQQALEEGQAVHEQLVQGLPQRQHPLPARLAVHPAPPPPPRVHQQPVQQQPHLHRNGERYCKFMVGRVVVLNVVTLP